ncbi:MAG: hypothetical protein QM784_04560 [Polyangiaceae bacterium]
MTSSFKSTLGLDEVASKYPNIPKLVLLKIDLIRRGVHYTKRAEEALDPTRDQLRSSSLFGCRDGSLSPLPEAIMLRDGGTALTDPTPLAKRPYTVDWDGGRWILLDGERFVDEVYLWPRPQYYDKSTSTGKEMRHIVAARPQRLQVFAASYCHFWNNDKGCRYCDIVPHARQQGRELGAPQRPKTSDVVETIHEALKEKGRFSTICMTSGSDTRGAKPFDAEVDYYVELLKGIGSLFDAQRFPSQLIATAFSTDQLERIYQETGLMSITHDIEVLDPELFDWICPGKEEWVGYHEWKARLVRAVDIFGRGRVGTSFVAGVEFATPRGWTDEDEAVRKILGESEELAEKGVNTVLQVWIPKPNSLLRDQEPASLEYLARLVLGLHEQRVKHRLNVDFDDYRRCGNHADTDLSRLLPFFAESAAA